MIIIEPGNIKSAPILVPKTCFELFLKGFIRVVHFPATFKGGMPNYEPFKRLV